MKKLIYLTLLSVFMLLSCLTTEDDDSTNSSNNNGSKNGKDNGRKVTYVASKKEYEETFTQVDDLVFELNKIISRGNFTEWTKYLSDSYYKTYSDKVFLSKLSENPGLKDFNIRLRSLRDYFRNVVVPSRSNTKIDEIQFITENKIKVYTITNNSKFVVYQLVRESNKWLITE